MLESLSCPSCFTHYGLRPERVHPSIRRARCFRCGHVFGVEEMIHHLFPPAPEPPQSLGLASPTATLEGIQPEDLLELDAVLSVPPPSDATEEIPADSALTLGDLDGIEDEILEQTLIIEAPPVPEEGVPEAESSDAAGAYVSAKDAISKLLGNSPAPVAAERRGTGRGSSMDVEATLDALEHTLGGTPTRNLPGLTGAGRQDPVMGSTIRLSPTELQAAMAAGAPASQAPTVAIPSLASTQPAFALQSQPTAADPNPTGDPNLLKIQVGQDTFQNVTLDQLTAWVEQGRVQDWHMVARQFSDNWIEAGKVPSLRPVFDRVRRTQPNTALPSDAAPAGFEAAPVKKGLFGWMSNRN